MNQLNKSDQNDGTNLDFLHPLFTGAYGENVNILDDLINEFLQDHIYWRRNFHPENDPPIPESAKYRDDYLDVIASMKQELYRLSADLKRSCPFFSPRYVGHMASDTLLPGLIARMITTLYNPNNVTEEAAPATLGKELDVGFQLAEMLGYSVDENETPCAWGHLTSGGTVANYEGLRNFVALQFYPLALADAAEAFDLDFGGVGPGSKNLTAYSDWELYNLSIPNVIKLRETCLHRAETKLSKDDFEVFRESIDQHRFESLGAFDFFNQRPDFKHPIVIVPKTAHYSWEKAMKVLGLGTSKLQAVDVDCDMRMSPEHLQQILDECVENQTPILAVIGVLGSTEFGTVDPIGDIIDLRDEFAERGLHFPVHVDAAWGGYLASVFRKPNGQLHDRETLRDSFQYFPSKPLYQAFDAMGEADSITVDPHKLGYIPYPAGAYVAKNQKIIDFIPQKAPYVFHDDSETERSPREKLSNLGQYILEGSKPGASAAAAYVTHKVVPLHSEGFGQILEGTIHACEYFFNQIQDFPRRLDGEVNVTIPFEPDSNLICLAINPADNLSTARMNAFGESLYDHMSVKSNLPVQQREFIASRTEIYRENLTEEHANNLVEQLGLAPGTFLTDPERDTDSNRIFLIRNTLMNPWLMYERDDKNYIDLYLDFLEDAIREELASN